MDIIDFANIPCASGAMTYLQLLEIGSNDVCTQAAFEGIRDRAKERIIEALQTGEIKYRRYNKLSAKSELLAYPVARMMVSCIDKSYLTKRYALAVAKSVSEHIKKLKNSALKELAAGFGIEITFDATNEKIVVHITDYIRHANAIHEPEWRLVNQTVKDGKLTISRTRFARLMEEAARKRVESGLPHEVPQDMREALKPYTTEIQEALNARASKQDFSREGLWEVVPDCFPPCMSSAIADVQANVNLSHTMRFAMTAFLLNIGMKFEKITDMFRTSPDFKEQATSYQIGHISGASGKTYTCPACTTMATNGNCPGKAMCKKIEHPMVFYRRKVWIMNKKQAKEVRL